MKPWFNKAFDTIINSYNHNKLPHALIIYGHQRIGKLELAQEIIKQLTNTNVANDNLAIVDGEDNILIRHSHYQGLIYIQNEIKKNANKVSQIISVNQTRRFCNFLEQTSSHLQIGIIKYGDTMHHSASNALLKTLEEPRDNTLIIILAHNLKNIPITILSRCQKIHLTANTSALAWIQEQINIDIKDTILEQLLEDNNYIPQRVVEKLNNGEYEQEKKWQEQLLLMAINPNNINKIEKIDTNEVAIIECLYNLVKYSIEAKLYEQTIENASHQHILQKTDIKMFFNFIDDLNKAKALLNTTINKKLLLDNLLIVWSHITHLKNYPKVTMETK